MGYHELDRLISEKRLWVKHQKSLDMPTPTFQISVWDIYQDIYQQAENLPEPEKLLSYARNDEHTSEGTKKSNVVVNAQYIRDTPRYQRLKTLESNLRKITLYNDYIRPSMKRKFSHLFEGQVVDGKELLSYGDEQFIEVAYRSILNREAEQEAIRNAIIAMHQPGASPLDLLESLVNSQEGKKRPVRIKGVRWKKCKLKLKRQILKIPGLGHVCRWLSAVLLLPSRLRELQNRITAIEVYKLYEISQNINYINQLNTENISDVKKQIETLDRRLTDDVCTVREGMEALHSQWADDVGQLENEIHILENVYTQQQELLTALQRKIEKYEQYKMQLQQQNEKTAVEKKKLVDRLYYDYKKNLMTKDFDQYRKDIQPYLDRLNQWTGDKPKDKLKIVDLGCGFCEWLYIMQEAGYAPLGVDSNDLMMGEARNEHHLQLVKKDAITFLNETESQSIDVLFSFHLIEHLTFDELMVFMKECSRVVKPGGLFVCATPNPENLFTATKEFYMDPTHRKPIPIELLAFYFEEFQFEVIDELKLNPRNEWPYEYKQNDAISGIVFRCNMEQESSVWGVKKS